MSAFIEMYCDGSYRAGRSGEEPGTLGAAWVRAVKDGPPIENKITLPKLHDSHEHGSDIAELRAAAGALESLPAGSNVRVHMDCKNVIEWLTTGQLSRKKSLEPAVLNAFTMAMVLKERMSRVEFVYTADKNSPNMNLAHTLARAASTPGSKKKKNQTDADQDSQRPSRPGNTGGRTGLDYSRN